MSTSSPLFICVLLLHIRLRHVNAQTVTILTDAAMWSDDYVTDSAATNGWANDQVVQGTLRTYHGWYFHTKDLSHAGYFWREFQCAYDSNISIAFDAYFGCYYNGDPAGVSAYVNEKKYEFYIADSDYTNDTDAIARNQTSKCGRDPSKFHTFSSTLQHSSIPQYTTFSIGFQVLGLNAVQLTTGFAAISNIRVTCNKLDANDPTPDSPPNTPAPTFLSVLDPIDNVACSEIVSSTNCTDTNMCGWNSQCICTGGDSVDLVFGIYSELGMGTGNEQLVESWLNSSVAPNINSEHSRVGLVTFGTTIVGTSALDYYADLDALLLAFNNIPWDGNEWLNFPLLFDEVLVQFDSITADRNSQQTLVILVDDNPRLYTDLIPLCQYRNAFFSRGIRVIVVLIDNSANQGSLDNYDCIVQNSFDLISVPSLSDLSSITGELAASLCPDNGFTLNPTTAPTRHPTVVTMAPTENPTTSTTARPTTKAPTTSTRPATTKADQSSIRVNVTLPLNVSTLHNQTIEESVKDIISQQTNISTDQIRLIARIPKGDGTQTLYYEIIGSRDDVDQVEENEDKIEQKIEEKTGVEVSVNTQDKTYGDSDSDAAEIKALLLGVIIACSVCTFVFIVVAVGGGCIYYRKCRRDQSAEPGVKESVELGQQNSHEYATPVPSVNANTSVPAARLNTADSVEEHEDDVDGIEIAIEEVQPDAPEGGHRVGETPMNPHVVHVTPGMVAEYNRSVDVDDIKDEDDGEELYTAHHPDAVLERRQTPATPQMKPAVRAAAQLEMHASVTLGPVNDGAEPEMGEDTDYVSDEHDDMYVQKKDELGPRPQSIAPQFQPQPQPGFGMNKQASLNTPPMHGMKSFSVQSGLGGRISPMNLSPNVSVNDHHDDMPEFTEPLPLSPPLEEEEDADAQPLPSSPDIGIQPISENGDGLSSDMSDPEALYDPNRKTKGVDEENAYLD